MQSNRAHGCSCPWHPYQVTSWGVGGLSAGVTYAVTVLLMPGECRVFSKQAVYLSLISLLLVSLVVWTGLLTRSDPTDCVVKQCRIANKLK